jgi:hypothetical protein
MNLQETQMTDEKRTFKLKPLSRDGVDSALSKAEHYRLLNQPQLAESICLDILAISPGHQKASVVLLLALTDQLGHSSSMALRRALDLAKSLTDEYARIYYTGIILERQGTAALNSGNPGAESDAFEWYMEAMELYEKADEIHPIANNDTILRWNTCARIIMQHNLRQKPADNTEPALE